MQHWPYWLGGLALAAVSLGHWLVLKRQMAVSGRFTAIVNRLRAGSDEDAHAHSVASVDPDELVAALRAMTLAEFGTDELTSAPPAAGAVDPEPLARPAAPPAMLLHGLFLGGLLLGGASSVATRTGGVPARGAESADFAAIFGHNPWVAYAVLLGAGVLVGFGTRMAGGCTSGHGLCGVSRLQKGSLLSTVAFFGAGVVTSFLLEAWS